MQMSVGGNISSGRTAVDKQVWEAGFWSRDLQCCVQKLGFSLWADRSHQHILTEGPTEPTLSYWLLLLLLVNVQLSATPWTAACQTSLSFTISLNLFGSTGEDGFNGREYGENSNSEAIARIQGRIDEIRIKRETVEIKVVYTGVVVRLNKYFRIKTEDLYPLMAPHI